MAASPFYWSRQVLAQHLGRIYVCREFAREGRIAITCLRLGNLGQTG